MKIKKKDIAKLIDLFNSLSFILGLFVYIKTRSFGTALTSTIAAIVWIQIVRFSVILINNKKLKKSGIHEVDKMTGLLFEEYLAVLFKARGYKVKETKATGDFGADLVLVKDGIKTVVQAKRYKSNVGIKAIQEIIGAVNHYQADKSMVVTNSYYTQPAIELAKTNNVELINRDQLVKMLLELNPSNKELKSKSIKTEIKVVNVAPKSDVPNCPSCNTQMVKRRNRNGGKFFGCSNFPACRKTLNSS